MSVTNVPDPSAPFCLVCRTALQTYVSPEGVTQHKHSHAPELFDVIGLHDPVPVPSSEFTRLNILCDFCDAPKPLYAYRLKELSEMLRSNDGVKQVVVSHDAWWAACVDCAPHIDACDVLMLAKSVKDRKVWESGERRAHFFRHCIPLWTAVMSMGVYDRITMMQTDA